MPTDPMHIPARSRLCRAGRLAFLAATLAIWPALGGAQVLPPVESNSVWVQDATGFAVPGCEDPGAVLPAGAPVSLVCALADGRHVLRGEASSPLGVLHAGLQAVNDDTFTSATGFAIARWADTLVLGGNVVPATVRFGIALQGSLLASALGVPGNQASAAVDFTAQARPDSPLGGFDRWAAMSDSVHQQGPGTDARRVDETTVFDLPVLPQWGTTDIQFRMTLTLQVGASCWQTASPVCRTEANADFAHTAGLASLQFLDAAGQDITASVQHRWLHGLQPVTAVPEPSAALLALTGLLGLGAAVRRRVAGAAAVAAVLLPLAGAAVAQPVQVAGSVLVDSALMQISGFRSTAAPTGPLRDTLALGSGANVGPAIVGGGWARYEADFGTLRAAAAAHVRLDADLPIDAIGDTGAAARASWTDHVTFTAPGLAGTRGTVRVRLDLSGGLRTEVAGDGRGSDDSNVADTGWSAALTLGRGVGHSQQRSASCTARLGTGCVPLPGSDPLGRWISEPIEIVFGWPTELTVQLDAGVYLQTRLSGTTRAVSDLSHTLAWGGIAELLDAQGAPVGGWSVSSASGTDWSLPVAVVPEPRAALLLAFGLGVLGAVLRRQSAALRRAASAQG
jgi:hypothetical protein